ncbi:MAG TPA: nuclear transport factor 2 family protein [Pseudonocardiaceae bacterium]
MTDRPDDAALQRLLDRDGLVRLSGTYLRGLDRRDAELLRSVFHDDATTHYGAFRGGPDDFVAMAMRALSGHETNQHFLGQINLWFGPEAVGQPVRRATGEVYFQAFHRVSATDGHGGARTDLFICGRYVDRYECRDGDWRIAHRTEIVDWARTEPTADDYLPTHPHAVLGRRDRTDLSYRIAEA